MKRVLFAILVCLLPLGAAADGPMGIGALQLGLTQSQVAALPHSGLVYLVTPLVPYQYPKGAAPIPGQTMLSSKAMTPWSSTPLDATLTFEDGILTEVGVDIDKYTINNVRDEITEKYGNPHVNNGMHNQQCLYHNGANFTIQSGTMDYMWVKTIGNSKQIETSIFTVIFDVCPSNLMGDRVPPSRSDSIMVRYKKSAENRNPF